MIRRESGQALIEFALIAPVLAILLFGIVDFAQGFNIQNDETNWANIAARYGAVIGTASSTPTCGGSATADAYAFISCQAASDNSAFRTQVGVCVNDELYGNNGQAGGGGTAFSYGDPVKIQIQLPFQFLAILGIHSTIDITSSATMMLESGVTSGTAEYNWLANTNTDAANPANTANPSHGYTACSAGT